MNSLLQIKFQTLIEYILHDDVRLATTLFHDIVVESAQHLYEDSQFDATSVISLTEISSADVSPKTIVPAEQLRNTSTIGQIDGFDIGELSDNAVTIYFIKDSKLELDAYILISNEPTNGYYRLHRLFNSSSNKGVITALVIFVIVQLKKKLFLAADEELTAQGFKWLIKLLLAKGRGLSITDHSGKFPDLTALSAEWNNSIYSWNAGPTEIFFENKNIVLPTIAEDCPKTLLTPMHKYIGGYHTD